MIACAFIKVDALRMDFGLLGGNGCRIAASRKAALTTRFAVAARI
jgi:hypothetical protein